MKSLAKGPGRSKGPGAPMYTTVYTHGRLDSDGLHLMKPPDMGRMRLMHQACVADGGRRWACAGRGLTASSGAMPSVWGPRGTDPHARPIRC